MSYDSGAGNGYIFGNLVMEQQYDWGSGSPGTLLYTKKTSYQWSGDDRYLSSRLLDLPSSVQILDANENKVSETDYGYDEYSLQSSGISTGLNTPPGSVRGNLTTVKRWSNLGTPSTMHSYWYDTGEKYMDFDANATANSSSSPTKTYTYASEYAGGLLTGTTDALGNSVSAQYDFNTSLMTSFTDQNGNTSAYSYDSMWRPTNILYPNDASEGQGETGISYLESDYSLTRTISKKIDSSGHTAITDELYDGLGFAVNTQTHTGSDPINKDTHYDALGRVLCATNPYISSSDTTYGSTCYTYDGLGRVVSEVRTDGAQTTTTYSGSDQVSTDANGNQWKRTFDALGRIVSVIEPNGSSASPSLQTTYSYDALGNLTSVIQNGNSGDSPRVRSYTYDSLSRLICSSNVESSQSGSSCPSVATTSKVSGTEWYTYDANGNLLTRTDARGKSVLYSYDTLNRLVSKVYQ